ncbi:MAG: hypothetical protein E7646_04415 [Ruminococcaceae bacterium]|nr:hypothetical protein [Oscillospiraceae bacterium]
MDNSGQWQVSEKEYRNLSRGFGYYKFICLGLCLVFILGGLAVFKDDITVENFRYLIKYIDIGSGDLAGKQGHISFDSAESSGSTAGIYRNDLVLLNKNNFEVFDFSGGKVYNDTFSMSEPSLNVSSRYVFCYDLGGKTARLYNSFSLVWQQSYEYPIFCGDVNDMGNYAVATSEKNYHSAVYVYNSASQQIFKWLSADKYVSDVALADNNSDKLCVAALRAENGDFITDLLFFSVNDKESSALVSFPGEMPLKTYATEDCAMLMTDVALHFVSYDGTELASVKYSSESLGMYGFFRDGAVLVLDDNSVGGARQVLFCNKEKGKAAEFSVDKQIVDVSKFEDCVYLLCTDAILVLDTSSGEIESYTVEGEYTQLFVTGEGSCVLVNSFGADLTVLDKQT